MNMAKNYGAESKSDLHNFDPMKIVLVTDPGHPLYDPNALLPPKEDMVRSMMQLGVLEPILVRENGRTDDGPLIIECVAGRKRLTAIREANRRLVEAGKEPKTIPAYVRRDAGDANVARLIKVAENEIRYPDPPSVRAAKALEMEQAGMRLEEIATAFGLSPSATKHLIAMAGLDKPSRDAIDAGTLPLSSASHLAVLPENERAPILEQASGDEEGKKKGRKALVRAAQEKERKAVSRAYNRSVRTKKDIEEALADLREGTAAHKALEWVLGRREELA